MADCNRIKHGDNSIVLTKRRTLNVNQKIFSSNRLNGQKFFSILSPINYNISCKYTEKYKSSKSVYPHRHFSLLQGINSFNTSFYESVTSSTASEFVKNFLIQAHDVTGLPWWATIMATTASVRLFVNLPLGIYQQYLVAKIKLTKIELDSIVKELKQDILLQARRGKWTKSKANLHLIKEVKKNWKILVVKNNCHPFKSVIINLSQLPVWLLFSMTLRKLASEAASGTSDSIVAAMQFNVGGVFWSPNLTLPDLTSILPVTITLCTLLLVELNVLSATHVLSLLSKIMNNLLRGFAIIVFLVSMGMPSCVTLYWATSVMLGLAQNILLLSPRMRRLCRIPKTPQELDKPYSHVLSKFVEKWANLGRKCGSLFIKK